MSAVKPEHVEVARRMLMPTEGGFDWSGTHLRVDALAALLSARDEAMIEKCAKVADYYADHSIVAKGVAAAIRKLKE